MSVLSENDIRTFWIRVYLGSNPNVIEACINRAYRDFSRTMRGIGKEQTLYKRTIIQDFIRVQLESILTHNFKTHLEFDEWHRNQCQALKKRFNEIYTYRFTIGQAQKWINMSLKYFYAVGEDKIPGISKNYPFFHIPIDNIIQDKLLEKGIPILNTTWSGLDSYKEYINYQEVVRKKFIGGIPMDMEFKLFNELNYLK